MRLLVSPEGDLPSALALAGKVALGTWVILTSLQTGIALARPHPASPTGGAVRRAPVVAPIAVVVAGAFLIVLQTVPATGRLAATLLCYLILAVALGWVVWRRAGAGQAARALSALAVFAAVAAGADVRPGPRIEESQPDSAYRWVAGWPTESWVLRHELRPPAPLPPHPMTLKLPLAAPYDGPARVYAALNGHDLGPGRVVDRRRLYVDVPPELVAGPDRLVFELRQDPPDPRLRLSAHRWGNAATAGPGASSYFDGRRWWPGTFDDARGRPRPGIYVLQLDPR